MHDLTPNLTPTQIQNLLAHTKIIAVVGLSSKPDRASYQVSRYMQQQGYQIVPVNPSEKEILGEICYPQLTDIPFKVDMVNVFRKAEDCLPIVQEAIQIGAKSIWLQLGILDEASQLAAHGANIPFVMDRCLKIDHCY